MFGLSGTEILVVALVALLLFGPSRIPDIARALGRAYQELIKVRRKVDETLGELRQEIDLNLNEPSSPAPTPRPAGQSAGTARESAGASTFAGSDGAPRLPVPEEDDYLALAVACAEAEAEPSSFGLEDYLREGGG